MRKILLNKLSAEQLKLIRLIGKIAEKNKFSAYLVGGIVRDLLLGKLSQDLDIVVEGNGVKFARDLARRLKNIKSVYHHKFGTATLWLAGNLRIDIATCRKEVYDFPGALPKVESGTIKDDLLRRDFSINALAVRLDPKGLAGLVDFCAGISDLKKGKIRVIHDLSFVDDPTRILRAIRFKERFSFILEGHTVKLLESALRSAVLNYLKSPRLFAEFKKLLSESNPKKAILSVAKICGLGFIHPRIKLDKKLSRLLGAVEREMKWFKSNLSKRIEPEVWLIYFMSLLSGLSSAEKKVLLEKFNLNSEDRKKIADFKEAGLLKSLSKKTANAGQVYRLLKPLSYETVLFLKSSNKSRLVNRRIENFLRLHSHIKTAIGGSELRSLGFKEGRNIGRVLEQILLARIEGRLNSRREELNFASKILKDL